MEEVVIYFTLIIACGYFVLLFLSFLNWIRKFADADQINLHFEPKVSIIISFRNEAKVLSQLISSLRNQNYLNFEVILVNDHSTDDSLKVLQQSSWDKMTIINQETGNNGKKYALELGVKKSNGELLLFTDADCTFSEVWVKTMVYGLQKEQADWYAGSIRYQLKENIGLSSFFQALESVYLMMISSWTIIKKIPTTCNGANILIKKSVFQELDGFDGLRKTPSGDDELFMQKVKKAGGYKLSYSFQKESIVTTQPALSWEDLLNQRFRWASKLKNNLLPYNFILAVCIFSFHVVSILTLFINWKVGICIVFLRFVLEIWGGVKAFKIFSLKFNFQYFVISFFVYPLYVIFMSIATQVAQFSWKGRKY